MRKAGMQDRIYAFISIKDALGDLSAKGDAHAREALRHIMSVDNIALWKAINTHWKVSRHLHDAT